MGLKGKSSPLFDSWSITSAKTIFTRQVQYMSLIICVGMIANVDI